MRIVQNIELWSFANDGADGTVSQKIIDEQ